MRTYLDCIPCFYRQALDAARIAGADEIKQKKIIDELSQLIPDFPLEASPPEMGRARMPKADMPWIIYDQNNKEKKFIKAITIGDSQ